MSIKPCVFNQANNTEKSRQTGTTGIWGIRILWVIITLKPCSSVLIKHKGAVFYGWSLSGDLGRFSDLMARNVGNKASEMVDYKLQRLVIHPTWWNTSNEEGFIRWCSSHLSDWIQWEKGLTCRLAGKDSKHRQCVKLCKKSEKRVVGVKSSLF